MTDGILGGYPGHWQVFGRGAREALMIHCSLAHSGAWRPLAGCLSDDLTMTAFDLPGHGRSAAWDGVTDIQRVSTAMAAALLPDTGTVDLIGHSFGATVALRLAVEYPDRVRSLMLIEPVYFAAVLKTDPDSATRYTRDMASFTNAWGAGDRANAAREFTRLWGDALPWEAVPEAQRAVLTRQIHLIPAANDALHNDPDGILAPGRLEELTVPVLLVEGSETNWIMSGICAALAARLPNASQVTIEGAGHMAPLTHASAVAGHLRDLLERAAPAQV